MMTVDGIFALTDMLDKVIAVISLLVAFFSALPGVVEKALFHRRRRALRALLGNEHVVIHIPSRDDPNRLKPVVAAEDYGTFERIRDILTENGFEVKLRFITPKGDIEIEEDKGNIVVCGPKNSPAINETFLAMEELDFAKDRIGWYFKVHGLDEPLYSPQEKRDSQYAFLGKLPLAKTFTDKEVVLICGIHAIGSDGVAFFLGQTDQLDQLLKMTKGQSFFTIITSAYAQVDKEIFTARIAVEPRIIRKN